MEPVLTPATLFHVVTPAYWATQEDEADYAPATFEAEGFIHLCTEEQITGVLERYFGGEDAVMLVHISTKDLVAPLRWEPSPATGELFPHLYGRLNKSAIEGAEMLSRAE